MYAQLPAMAGNGGAQGKHQAVFPDGADNAHLGKLHRCFQPPSCAVLGVQPDEQRIFCRPLVPVGQFHLPHRFPLEKNQAPEVVFPHLFFQLLLIGCGLVAVSGNHEQLPDFLLQGHPLQGRVYPGAVRHPLFLRPANPAGKSEHPNGNGKYSSFHTYFDSFCKGTKKRKSRLARDLLSKSKNC